LSGGRGGVRLCPHHPPYSTINMSENTREYQSADINLKLFFVHFSFTITLAQKPKGVTSSYKTEREELLWASALGLL